MLEQNKQKQMDRHVKVLESLIEEVHELKVKVQSMRIKKLEIVNYLRNLIPGMSEVTEPL